MSMLLSIQSLCFCYSPDHPGVPVYSSFLSSAVAVLPSAWTGAFVRFPAALPPEPPPALPAPASERETRNQLTQPHSSTAPQGTLSSPCKGKAAKFYLLKQNFKVIMDDYSTSSLSSVKLRFLTCCSLESGSDSLRVKGWVFPTLSL